MAGTHFWGAPRRIGERTPLISRKNERFDPDVPVFQSSQKMAVSLRGFMANPPAIAAFGHTSVRQHRALRRVHRWSCRCYWPL
jgi:hypothetical protein